MNKSEYYDQFEEELYQLPLIFGGIGRQRCAAAQPYQSNRALLPQRWAGSTDLHWDLVLP